MNESVHPVVDTENNRLVFKTQEHFVDFIRGMSEVYTTHVGLDALETELEFRSLRSHINDLRDKLAESPAQDSLAYFEKYNRIEALDIVEDPLFATMLNENGEIKIGDIIHKVGRFFVHSIHEDYEHLLRKVDNLSNVEFKNEHVDVFHIEGQSDISSLGKSTSSPLSTDTCQHRYHGKQYRVNGKSWIKDYEFYGSAGTQTYHYKRINNFGGYHTRRVNHIAVATTVNLYNYGMHHSYTNHTVSNHESHVVVFTFQGGGLSSAGIHGYIDSHHHVRRSDGTTAGCGTYVSRQPS